MNAREKVNDVARCPVCAVVVEYKKKHEHDPMGDPAGNRALQLHDYGDHRRCDERGCEDAGRANSNIRLISDFDAEGAMHDLAADLLEMHIDTGISLDRWTSARALVEEYYGDVEENGV